MVQVLHLLQLLLLQVQALQSLGGPTGDFTGVNKFNNLEINNDAGLDIGLNGSVEVNNELLLTNGIINTTLPIN